MLCYEKIGFIRNTGYLFFVYFQEFHPGFEDTFITIYVLIMHHCIYLNKYFSCFCFIFLVVKICIQ